MSGSASNVATRSFFFFFPLESFPYSATTRLIHVFEFYSNRELTDLSSRGKMVGIA